MRIVDFVQQSGPRTPGSGCHMENTSHQNLTRNADNRQAAEAQDVSFYRTILQAQPVGTVVFDTNLRAVWSNPLAISLTGPLNDLSDDLTSLAQPGLTVDWPGVLTEVVSLGQSASFSAVQIANPNGRSRTVDILLTPLAEGLPGGRVGGLMVLIDVTNQLGSLARRLAISERMAALGRLAAKVAHELNNPLDGILRYISLAQRVAADGAQEKAATYLSNAKQGLLRMSRILGELLDFSRCPGGGYQRQDIDSMIQQAITTIEPAAEAADVAIITSRQGGKPTGHSDLFQVFCNLAKNAVDAMPGGGRLTISTSVDRDAAVVRFKDTGDGLPADVERIFEPFFTTKPQGQGTGLGLAISKEIVEKCGGRITADNAADGGAVFEIRIPINKHHGPEENDCHKDH